MILKYALFRAQKLLASVTKQFTVSKTQTFSEKLLDSIDKCFFGSDVSFRYIFLQSVSIRAPERLRLFERHFLKNQKCWTRIRSTRRTPSFILDLSQLASESYQGYDESHQGYNESYQGYESYQGQRVVLGVQLASKQGLKLRNVTTTAVNPPQAQLIISNKHSRNIILSRELYSIQNYENCSHRGSKRANYAGSAFL